MTLRGEKRAHFRDALELCLRRKKGTPFQEFASKVFARIHGDNFVAAAALGSLGDSSCDGRLNDPLTIFACYGPANGGTYLPERDMRTAMRKVRADFEGARAKWPEMKAWVFVHNFVEGVPPLLLQALDEVTAGTGVGVSHFGPDSFEARLLQMEKEVVEDLVGLIATRGDYMAMQPEAVQQAVDAVAEAIFTLSYLSEPTERVPADKVQVNDIPSAYAQQMRTAAYGRPAVEACLERSQDPTLTIRLSEAFRTKYLGLREQRLSPGEVVAALHGFATAGKPDCVQTQIAAWSIVAYLFERCIVFEPGPAGET